MKNHKCELLAPAGGPTQFIAAVENGADAIYLGGKAFGARAGAENFDRNEMEKAIDFGHLRGVKSYVTMNTLLSDDMLPSALEYAKFLYQIGADGLIVQDLGLGYLVRNTLPDFPLHLSTQGSVYDRRGVEAASLLGYSRVVLARELNLEEIRQAAAQSKVEIEVFVHGALCICYSGQCQMSRFIGGRSGNRGQCAQPCRLPYAYYNQNGKQIEEKRKYPLSPKDLCLIRELGALKEAGVTSLKIEGRMKSAEYVAVVTSAYRKYIDLYEANGSYTVEKEDWNALTQIFNRGGFTKGYFYGDPGKDLICDGLPKHQGVRIGKVEGRVDGSLITIKPEKGKEPLRLGDGIEIHSRNLTGNVITYLKETKKGLLQVGDIKDKVEAGDLVYKITSRSLKESAQDTFENLTFEEGKYKRKLLVTASFTAEAGSPARLDISEPIALTIEEPQVVGQIPQNRQTSAEDIIKQLSKTGGTPFQIKEITVNMETPLWFSLADINALRRNALSLLELRLKQMAKRVLPQILEQDIIDLEKPLQKEQEATLQLYFYDIADLFAMVPEIPKVAVGRLLCLIDAKSFLEQYRQICILEQEWGVTVCPSIPAVSKGADGWLEKHIDELASKCRNKRKIFVGNLAWIKPLTDRGAETEGNPELNICNKRARSAYSILGLTSGLESFETEENIFGAYPLMVTEHEMEAGLLKDKKGHRFLAQPTSFCQQTLILPQVENTLSDFINLCKTLKKRLEFM